MLVRYTRPEMQELWRAESKFGFWLRVELAVLKARERLDDLPQGAYGQIREHAGFTVARIDAIEAETRHDMIAFVKCVHETLVANGVPAEIAEELHKRLTSYNVEDPAMILMLREATKHIVTELRTLIDTMRAKATEHQWTLMVARTHGQHAEPDTFGHQLLVYASALERSWERLEASLGDELGQGNISGAVGTYAGMDPEMERLALDELGLEPALAETQILQRDRHATLLWKIAVCGATIEQMCRTFWEMMRSEVRELQEPRGAKQRGSSIMPHKVNPILTEQLQGMARLLRAHAHVATENIATPEGRDISQSCTERHIFPDATSQLHYMIVKATGLVRDLVVFKEQMDTTLEARTQGTWAGGPLRVALQNAGISYDASYLYVQRIAFQAVERQDHMLAIAEHEPISDTDPRTARDVLGEDGLKACFDARAFLEAGIAHIFRTEES